MQQSELLELIDKGEDSRTQFKKDITNAIQLAQEMVAFSNSKGGFIIVGVDDSGNFAGLDSNDIRRLNQLISNSANENKRKISQEELMRLFQESGKIYADEMIVHDSSENDIDKELFCSFYEKQYGENILNLAGLLLFGKNPQRYEPVFLIKAVCFYGNEMDLHMRR